MEQTTVGPSRRLVRLLGVAAIVFSLFACGGSTKSESTTPNEKPGEVASSEVTSSEVKAQPREEASESEHAEAIDAKPAPVEGHSNLVLGAAITHFLKFRKDETRAQVEKKHGSLEGCTFDEKKVTLTCPIAGLSLVKKVSYRLFGHKLHSIRLRFAATTSWEKFGDYERQMRELIRGTGPLTEGGLVLYELKNAKERLQRKLNFIPAIAVMFEGEGLGPRGRLSGKVFSFQHQGKTAYGFEILWLPRDGK